MEQHYYIGPGSICEIERLLDEYVPHHLLLVRGKHSYSTCGAQSILENIFSRKSVVVTSFFDFDENPKFEDLQLGLKLLSAGTYDMVLAIGGGSVLDMAKLLRFFYGFTGDVTSKSFEQTGPILPLIAVPTTAGTGSETTHFSVLYKAGVKYSVAHAAVRPDIAIVDPKFTYSNPPYLTACTGFDALAQAIEAYWNIYATSKSDQYAMKALKLLWLHLSNAVHAPTPKSRDAVAEGAYWAGRAINITKTTAPHAFSYPITTNYQIPHGHAVALTFPYFWDINVIKQENLSPLLDKKVYSRKCNDLKKIIDRDMHTYISELGLDLTISASFDKTLILTNVNEERLVNNPVWLDFHHYIDIF